MNISERVDSERIRIPSLIWDDHIIRISLARNERELCQLALVSDALVNDVSFSIRGFPSYVRSWFYRAHYIPTDGRKNRIAEPLELIRSPVALAAVSTNLIWAELYAPEKARAGKMFGTVAVWVGDRSMNIPPQITVYCIYNLKGCPFFITSISYSVEKIPQFYNLNFPK